ncbi:hypothetical protein CLU83_2793 [Flavobacterium sp. 1]|uniref:DUF6702 family protein n=1 Tax=Flavobacterium sp. 1 TaxID=2035200 RepID=UPI000C2452CA|nr:DUF6702 family protein [Flavobacterium sp. 1]PJJ09437.1 hypothetical protein CLU83_2793 [Flavobacterium sp. 1]
MKKRIVSLLLLAFIFSMSSFGMHKFYMAIYQINYAPEKKMLQITARIFADDFDKALEKKHGKKFFFGTNKETAESLELLKKYLAESFSLKVNGQSKTMNFLSKEMDGDVLVCYLSIKDISKIKEIEIYNSILTDYFASQQNIVNVTAFNVKRSFLFTETSTKEVLKY